MSSLAIVLLAFSDGAFASAPHVDAAAAYVGERRVFPSPRDALKLLEARWDIPIFCDLPSASEEFVMEVPASGAPDNPEKVLRRVFTSKDGYRVESFGTGYLVSSRVEIGVVDREIVVDLSTTDPTPHGFYDIWSSDGLRVDLAELIARGVRQSDFRASREGRIWVSAEELTALLAGRTSAQGRELLGLVSDPRQSWAFGRGVTGNGDPGFNIRGYDRTRPTNSPGDPMYKLLSGRVRKEGEPKQPIPTGVAIPDYGPDHTPPEPASDEDFARAEANRSPTGEE